LIGGVADVLCELLESIFEQSAVFVGQYENINLEFSKWVLKFLMYNLTVLEFRIFKMGTKISDVQSHSTSYGIIFS